jgi:hypothetical protein
LAQGPTRTPGPISRTSVNMLPQSTSLFRRLFGRKGGNGDIELQPSI